MFGLFFVFSMLGLRVQLIGGVLKSAQFHLVLQYPTFNKLCSVSCKFVLFSTFTLFYSSGIGEVSSKPFWFLGLQGKAAENMKKASSLKGLESLSSAHFVL